MNGEKGKKIKDGKFTGFRDPQSGAAISTDTKGYNKAKLRRKQQMMMYNQDKKNRQLEARINQLQQLVQALIDGN